VGENAIKTLQEFNGNTTEYFKIIKGIYHYTTHPVDLLLWLWEMAVKYSFYVCLSAFFICLVLYLIGVRKAARYAQISFFSYLAIQIFDAVI
jgi:hypothetical protein